VALVLTVAPETVDAVSPSFLSNAIFPLNKAISLFSFSLHSIKYLFCGLSALMQTSNLSLKMRASVEVSFLPQRL